MKLDIKAVSLACGILWGAAMFLLTWWLLFFEGREADISFITMFYRGYRLSPWGSLFGLAWGFVDGLIGGALFAWLYNRLAEKRGAKEAAQIGQGPPITP